MHWLSTICVLDAILGSEVGNRSFRTLPVTTLCALPNGGVGGTFASASATCRGLHPSVLESRPVLVFAAAPWCDKDAVECAVCLNELEEGEKMRAHPRMLSLTSLLGRDSRVCCGRETSTELERDPERGEGAATGSPPRLPSAT
ncbi:hypothetical protein C4D60_Mb01t27110 [Musa balbisiana]|uniref:RING-type domain-containing protein n=1 Tax=Musa balbisiana TaxID=52838 RepID=A0A4S8JR20_MUSBA|nr:hypothetical protein C4D60_Mb01t27110 [Musa balbisiana]